MTISRLPEVAMFVSFLFPHFPRSLSPLQVPILPPPVEDATLLLDGMLSVAIDDVLERIDAAEDVGETAVTFVPVDLGGVSSCDFQKPVRRRV